MPIAIDGRQGQHGDTAEEPDDQAGDELHGAEGETDWQEDELQDQPDQSEDTGHGGADDAEQCKCEQRGHATLPGRGRRSSLSGRAAPSARDEGASPAVPG